jgi:UDP-3-O-[3-hydroxymyristoyl] glucosamine N-acyltransferase
VLGQNVFVAATAVVGNRVKVQNNVSIYDGVTLEDGVFCGPSMVFTNVVNPRSEVVRKDEYKTTLVKRGASIGANATVVCGITIGSYAFVGGGVVTWTGHARWWDRAGELDVLRDQARVEGPRRCPRAERRTARHAGGAPPPEL